MLLVRIRLLLVLLVATLLGACATGGATGGGPAELREAAAREEMMYRYRLQQELILRLEAKVRALELEVKEIKKK